MEKNIRVQDGLLNHRLFSFILDLISVFVSTLAIYFLVLYTVFSVGFNYIEKNDRVLEIENEYVLNLEEELNYTEYEKVLKDFYFNKFPEEIKKEFNTIHKTDYTITHIYNIVVLRLTNTPTYESYKTDYYSYVQSADGSFNPDVLATHIEGSGKVYEKNMSDLFYSSYNDLKQMLKAYNDEYLFLTLDVFNYKSASRMIAFSISLLVFYIIIPLSNKYGSTLGEKYYKLGHVNKKDGYLVKKHKIIIRPIIYFLLPFIAVALGTKNAIIIVLMGYLFINFLLLIFSKDNFDIADRILSMNTCSIEESLLFKNVDEEIEYFKSEEGKKIEDPEFLEKLSNVKDFNLSISRDEELKKEK